MSRTRHAGVERAPKVEVLRRSALHKYLGHDWASIWQCILFFPSSRNATRRAGKTTTTGPCKRAPTRIRESTKIRSTPPLSSLRRELGRPCVRMAPAKLTGRGGCAGKLRSSSRTTKYYSIPQRYIQYYYRYSVSSTMYLLRYILLLVLSVVPLACTGLDVDQWLPLLRPLVE